VEAALGKAEKMKKIGKNDATLQTKSRKEQGSPTSNSGTLGQAKKSKKLGRAR